MVGDLGLADCLEMSKQRGATCFLSELAQPAVADDIGTQKGRKLALHAGSPSIGILAVRQGRQQADGIARLRMVENGGEQRHPVQVDTVFVQNIRPGPRCGP